MSIPADDEQPVLEPVDDEPEEQPVLEPIEEPIADEEALLQVDDEPETRRPGRRRPKPPPENPFDFLPPADDPEISVAQAASQRNETQRTGVFVATTVVILAALYALRAMNILW